MVLKKLTRMSINLDLRDYLFSLCVPLKVLKECSSWRLLYGKHVKQSNGCSSWRCRAKAEFDLTTAKNEKETSD
jgi:hypothetical protein